MDRHAEKAIGAQGFPWVALCASLTALLCHFFPALAQLLEYRREEFLAGEVWRLFTWHWVHWGADHLSWDLSAFMILGALIERYSRRSLVCLLFAAPVAVSVIVFLNHPALPSCRGLSGVASGLFGFLVAGKLAVAFREGRRDDLVIFSGLAVAFVAKVAVEGQSGSAIFARGDPFVVLPAAHLAGALAGVVVAMLGGISSRGAARRERKGSPLCLCWPLSAKRFL